MLELRLKKLNTLFLELCLNAILVLGLSVGILSICPAMVLSANAAEVTEVTGRGTVDTESLRVRTGPGKDYDVAGLVKKGDTVDITGEIDDWYRIDMDGSEGYVSADYVEVDGELTVPQEEISQEPDKKESKKDKEDELEDYGEPEEGYNMSKPNPRWFLILFMIIGILAVVLAIIFTLRKMGDEEDDDDYDEYEDDYEYEDEYEEEYEDEYEDEYEEDEEYDEYEEDSDEYYDDDSYEDEDSQDYDDSDYEDYEEEKESEEIDESQYEVHELKDGRREVIIKEEDYRVDIDPKFFETTTLIEQPDAVTGYIPGRLEKEEKLNEAMDQLHKLQEEIEKLKNES